MAGPRVLEKGFQFWPEQHHALQPADLVRMYNQGFAGVFREPEEHSAFLAEMPFPNGGDVAHRFGWAGSGAGKLVVPFRFIEQLYAGSLPGPAQQRGDCVSHSNKNAALLTMCCEVVAEQPDEVSGKIEAPPDVSSEGIRNGVLSTEAFYWWRGYGGDGWSCDAAARVATSKSGLWLRQNYPELGVDLTRYSGRNAGLYGSRRPPESFDAIGLKHLIRTATEVQDFESVRDFLHNGYGISTCGSEGYSSSRDENGVSRRSGSWAHAMAYFGADDREETKRRYGEPLVLVMNSWGVWNSGPRRILETPIDIPGGSFWAKWSDVRNRYCISFSGVDGWPAKKLPDLGFNVWG